MKKLSLIFISLITVLCVLCGNVSGVVATVVTTTPTIVVSDATVKAGESFDIYVELQNNPGIASFTFQFDFDTDKLTLDKVASTPELVGSMIYIKKAVWYNRSDLKYDGKIIVLSFTAKEDCPECSTPVSVSYGNGNICNYNEQQIHFDVVPGTVTVIPSKLGDINGDGKVNALDSFDLSSMILGVGSFSDKQTAKADLDKNGKLNALDVCILKEIILGIY